MFLASRRDPRKIGQSKFVSVEPRTTIGVENRKTFVEVGETSGNRATALEKVCALFSKLSNFNMYVSVMYIYIFLFLFLLFFFFLSSRLGAATETKRKLNDPQFFSMHRSGAWRLGSRSFERKLVFVGEQA